MSDITSSTSPIGILGGTFDPIHKGHLNMAYLAMQKLKLQVVHFVPCYKPAHRKPAEASFTHRSALIEIAIKKYKKFMLDDREKKRKKISYTLYTLKSFREEFPEAPLCLLMGLDEFAKIYTWHRFKELLTYTHIIVVRRPEIALSMSPEIARLMEKHETKKVRDIQKKTAGHIYFLNNAAIPASATRIREQIAQQAKTIRFLPQTLYRYIKKNHLYGY